MARRGVPRRPPLLVDARFWTQPRACSGHLASENEASTGVVGVPAFSAWCRSGAVFHPPTLPRLLAERTCIAPSSRPYTRVCARGSERRRELVKTMESTRRRAVQTASSVYTGGRTEGEPWGGFLRAAQGAGRGSRASTESVKTGRARVHAIVPCSPPLGTTTPTRRPWLGVLQPLWGRATSSRSGASSYRAEVARWPCSCSPKAPPASEGVARRLCIARGGCGAQSRRGAGALVALPDGSLCRQVGLLVRSWLRGSGVGRRSGVAVARRLGTPNAQGTLRTSAQNSSSTPKRGSPTPCWSQLT